MAGQKNGRQEKMLNKTDRVILSVTCYGHFLCHFNMLVFPAILLPLSGLLHMSMADTLNLAFFMYLLMGLSAPLWGVLQARNPSPGQPAYFAGMFYLGTDRRSLSNIFYQSVSFISPPKKPGMAFSADC